MAMQIEQMPIARVFFSKTGRAKYISHLDVMRMFTRAFRRSGLPVWHTQGFNPHVYMTFALPVALGYESLCESVDIRLTEEIPFDSVAEKLNGVLPPGFKAQRVAAPVSDPKEIACADYEVSLVYEDIPAQSAKAKFEAFLALPAIEVVKKTKKGEKTLDIKPLSEALAVSAEADTLGLKLRMASGITLNVNPTLLLKEFYAWSNLTPEGVKITRTAILTAEKRDFE